MSKLRIVGVLLLVVAAASIATSLVLSSMADRAKDAFNSKHAQAEAAIDRQDFDEFWRILDRAGADRDTYRMEKQAAGYARIFAGLCVAGVVAIPVVRWRYRLHLIRNGRILLPLREPAN